MEKELHSSLNILLKSCECIIYQNKSLLFCVNTIYVASLGFPLPPSPFLSDFFQTPFACFHLVFRQSSFHPCSVCCPPVGSAFHHPACRQETLVAPGRPAVSLIIHVTCSRRALASRKSMRQPSYSRLRCGEHKLSPPAVFIKMPDHQM